MEPTSMEGQPQPTGSQGPVVGIIIVIIVLIIGAFYFFSRLSPTDTVPEPGTTTEETPLGASDDTAAIEGDLSAQNPENVDAELGDINNEFAQ